MGKEGKHIGMAISLIAGLILFSHAVIPHNHHFDLLFRLLKVVFTG